MSSADRREDDRPAPLREFFQYPEQLGAHPVWPTRGMVRRHQREMEELQAGIGVIGNVDMPWPWESESLTTQPQPSSPAKGRGRVQSKPHLKPQ